MHAEIEKRLGNPVFTHQLGNKDFVDDKVMPAFKADFVSMCPEVAADALTEAG